MSKYKRISCFFILISFLLNANGLMEQFRSVALNGPLQNLRVFNDKIYIGGTNMLYVLDNDLSISQLASTCIRSTIPCGNINKILLVLQERNEICVCGIDKKGVCEIRMIDKIETVLRTCSEYDLMFDTYTSDPVQGIITMNGHVTLAVSQEPDYDYLYQFAAFISTMDVVSFNYKKYINAASIKNHFPEFSSYFKDVFQFNWYTYFVTNQKMKNLDSTNYVSKLISLYQNEKEFDSYSDKVLSCKYDGIEYNLIQKAVLIDTPSSFGLLSNDRIFVGAFTRGNDPTNPTGNTAICVSKISDMFQDNLKAKENFELLFTEESDCFQGVKGKDSYVYLKLLSGDRCYTHKMTATYLLGTETGHVTALDGTAISSENIVLIAGTSVGFLLQITMTSLESPMEMFSTTKLESPIIHIHIQEEDTIYVLGSQHVYSYSQSNCSEFKSVTETMAGRNPLCGWCVFQQRATRKPNCSEARYHWISSIHKIHLTPSKINVRVSKITPVKVMISFDHLPKPRMEDVFKCRLVDNKNDIIALDIQAENNGSVISCAMPFINEHVELKLGVSVQTTLNKSILISEAAILFFECVKLQRCCDCIEISNHQCSWCNGAVKCMSQHLLCKSQFINEKKFCPQLTDSRGRLYVHAGILTSVLFEGKHLPKSESKNFYACKMNSTALSRASTVNDAIICSINVHHLSDVSLQNETTEIYYGSDLTGTSILMNEFKTYVTVYNCTMLAKDCSLCKALNKTRFHCDWCTNTNKCEFKDQNCSSTACPAPTITKVIPRDGHVEGGTTITVYGINLGSSLFDINSVEIAEIPCEINYNMSQSNDIHNGIFELNVPHRIICVSGSSQNERSGTVSVSVNGLLSSSDFIFFYRNPLVTGIVPNYGPEAGGTRITLFGKNLGIGNRNVNVKLDNILCLRPEVRPKIPRGNKTPTNFTIVCTTDKKRPYSYAVTNVYVEIDRREIIKPNSFTFVDNPIIQPFFPKIAFLSGGTKIKVEGEKLHNAHNARLTVGYKLEIEIGGCIILSESLATCEIPKAPKRVQEELLEFKSTTHQFSKNVTVAGVIHFDNVRGNIDIRYYPDPIVSMLSEGEHVVKFKEDERLLNISGYMLNYVATKFDINVTVGVESCVIVELNLTCLTCIPPKHEPKSRIPNAKRPEVNVTIGNIHKMIGYVEYVKRSPSTIMSSSSSASSSYTSVVLLATGAGAALIFISATAVILTCRQYRKTKSRLRSIVNQNSKKEKIPCELRLTRVVDSSSEVGEVYNEPYESDHYDTIIEDNLSIYRCVTDNNSLYCPYESVSEVSTPTSEQSQNYLSPTNHVTVEVQLEETIATNVKSKPELTGEQLYLHVIKDSDLLD